MAEPHEFTATITPAMGIRLPKAQPDPPPRHDWYLILKMVAFVCVCLGGLGTFLSQAGFLSWNRPINESQLNDALAKRDKDFEALKTLVMQTKAAVEAAAAAQEQRRRSFEDAKMAELKDHYRIISEAIELMKTRRGPR